MYKLSVPVSIQTMNERSLPIFVEEFRKAEVDRVFLCGLTPFYKKDCYIYKEPDRMAYLISYFKKQGFEVGVWEGAFGHGGVLTHDKKSDYVDVFTRIVGADGKMEEEAFCPLDENFRTVYYSCVKKLAAMQPDIIMFDDDFRLNTRRYNMGCCCDRHLKLLSDRVGEEVPRDRVEALVYCGGENRYRSAWLQVMGESLLDFAKLMRAAVDEVDAGIRLGCCMCHDTWDYSGTDGIALAKAFAGNTKPFLRTIGAPYHSMKVQNAVEYTRMQAAWCRGQEIEVFTEGDVYPRPRYAVPANLLEVFDLALLATGETDGILKYMFDYDRSVTYEMGYTARHVKNQTLRAGIKDLFAGKQNIGVRVYEEMHRVEKLALPQEYVPGVATFVENTIYSPAQKLLCENAIPAAYHSSTDYPVIAFGENARYIQEEELKNGAILDIVAAAILTERGIDVGMVHCEKADFSGELFVEENDEITNIQGIAMYKTECAPQAVVKSRFMPEGTAASYLYKNEKGTAFYVLSIDAYRSDKAVCNYFNTYHRQSHLIDAVQWLCKRPLPAVCTKNPFLYMQTARGGDGCALTVALYNVNIDDVLAPEVILDQPYSEARFLNCDGQLHGDRVQLSSDIAPYGVAVFEVRLTEKSGD